MANNHNYNFKVDLSNIPSSGNMLRWKDSEGKTIDFTSDILDGQLLIKKYISSNERFTASHLIVEYNGIELPEVPTSSIKNGVLGRLLSNFLPKKINWYYNINERIIKNDLDVTIIDRKMLNTNQCYKIKCNKCGFDSGAHIPIKSKGKDMIEEYWAYSGNLKSMKSCPCCGKFPTAIVKGINDIVTTDPWMVDYFIGGKEEASKYISGSSDEILMKCKDCGEKRNFKICVLKNTGYLPCVCRPTVSIPNKISYYTFKSLGDKIQDYEREYSPSWIREYSRTIHKNMSYDNYFKIGENEYIVEMDGGFHFNDNKMNGMTKEVAQERDSLKDKLAINHGINIIRVVAPDGQYHQTYLNLINSIKDIVDVSILDENDVMNKVHENFVKVICDYYNEYGDTKTMNEISKQFNIHIHTLRDYLKLGVEYGWCDYKNKNTLKQENIKSAVVKLFNNGMTAKQIAKELDEDYKLIHKYLQQEKLITVTMMRTGKKVYVYDLNGNYISEYNSQNELERNSFSDFGVNLRARSISRVCTGERKHYKGYIFSFTQLDKTN